MAQEEQNAGRPPAGQEEPGQPGKPPSPRETVLDILASLVLIVPAMLVVTVVGWVLLHLRIQLRIPMLGPVTGQMGIPALIILIIAFAVTFWCCRKAKPAIVAILRRILGKTGA